MATWFDCEVVCPGCGDTMEAVQWVGGAQRTMPADGDWSTCVMCGQFAIFVVGPVGMALRLPTPEEAELMRALNSDAD